MSLALSQLHEKSGDRSEPRPPLFRKHNLTCGIFSRIKNRLDSSTSRMRKGQPEARPGSLSSFSVHVVTGVNYPTKSIIFDNVAMFSKK